jgi:AcrR family transcriptional regulator
MLCSASAYQSGTIRSSASLTGMSPLAGRKAQAARNDDAILDAARAVFLADPKAPVSAVAERAGVGISALYRRYASKDDLLRRLCHDGLRRFLDAAEAVADEPDGWRALTMFLGDLVDADVHSLTVRLAGTFTPTPQMSADAVRANDEATAIVARAHRSGRLRPEVVPADVALILEACAAIRVPDESRARELRRRILAALLAGLANPPAGPALPGPPPADGEMNRRWHP